MPLHRPCAPVGPYKHTHTQPTPGERRRPRLARLALLPPAIGINSAEGLARKARLRLCLAGVQRARITPPCFLLALSHSGKQAVPNPPRRTSRYPTRPKDINLENLESEGLAPCGDFFPAEGSK